MKLIWTREAVEKLSEIEIFIARDSPERAERFVNFLLAKGESIIRNPGMGRIVPEIANPNISEIIVKKYRIVYHLRGNQIEVLTVFEGHRLLRTEEIKID